MASLRCGISPQRESHIAHPLPFVIGEFFAKLEVAASKASFKSFKKLTFDESQAKTLHDELPKLRKDIDERLRLYLYAVFLFKCKVDVRTTAH